MARLDYLSTSDIRDLTGHELNAVIKRAYQDAADLLDKAEQTSIGSGVVIDFSGTDRAPRIVGPVEVHGHLARQAGYLAVPTTGRQALFSAQVGAVVDFWRGAVVGKARAVERRDAAVRRVRETLADRSAAAGLDPRSLYSDGVRMPMHTIAERLVDLAIDRIEHIHQGDTTALVDAGLALVPDDAFTAGPEQG